MKLKTPSQTFKALQEGNENALEFIMDQYSPIIFNYIKKIVKSDQDAQELTQDTFIKLWQNSDNLESPRALKAYVFSIARNGALNFIRDNKESIESFDDDKVIADLSLKPSNEYERDELLLQINSAIDKMPKQRRTVFLMSREEGLSNVDIAKKLNLSPVTVSRHLSIAVEELRNYLKMLPIVLFIFLALFL